MTPECEQLLAHPEGTPLPPALAAHLEGCAACRAMVRGRAALPSAARPPAPPLPSALRAELAAVAGRPARRWGREALGVLALLACGAVLAGILMGPVDARPLRLLSTALLLGGLCLSVWAALAPWGVLRLRQATAAVGALCVSALGVALLLPLGETRGVGCALIELGLGAPPLALALRLLTGMAPSRWRTALAGAGAALLGLAALALHCPDVRAVHLGAAHLVPGLVLVGVAAAVRARLPTRSFAP